MCQLQSGETWYGKTGTVYQDVEATITNLTIKFVQLRFDHPVRIETTVLGGCVLGKRAFLRFFEPIKQITLFDDL